LTLLALFANSIKTHQAPVVWKLVEPQTAGTWYCCNLSGGFALIVWFTTNGMCVKNNTIHICCANK